MASEDMYINWNLRSELSFRGLRWFDIDDIVDLAQAYRESLFIRNNGVIHENTYLPYMSPTEVPFGPNRRFPRDRLYISQGFGDWDKHLHNFFLIASTLAHHDRLDRGYRKFGTLGDAELTMLEQLNEILTKLEKFEDVFDQRKFEETFGLTRGNFAEHIDWQQMT